MSTQRKTAKSAKKSSKTTRSSSKPTSQLSGRKSSSRARAGASGGGSRSGSRSTQSAGRGRSAGAGKTSGGRRAKTPNALELLSEDHRNVQKMFRKAERLESGDAQLQEIVQTACAALTLHAQIEEQLFYPALRESGAEEDLLDEAQVEHDVAKQLIGQLEGMGARDEGYKATFKVLGEYVNHHIEEEESRVFRAARRAKLDLASLAEQITLLKQGGAGAQAGEQGAGESSRGGSRSTRSSAGGKQAGRGAPPATASRKAGGVDMEATEDAESGLDSDETAERARGGRTDGDSGGDSERPDRGERSARSAGDEESDEGIGAEEIDVETPGRSRSSQPQSR